MCMKDLSYGRKEKSSTTLLVLVPFLLNSPQFKIPKTYNSSFEQHITFTGLNRIYSVSLFAKYKHRLCIVVGSFDFSNIYVSLTILRTASEITTRDHGSSYLRLRKNDIFTILRRRDLERLPQGVSCERILN